jgi:hypothetical protein
MLHPGDIIYSPDQNTGLVLRADGNLVLFSGGDTLWSSDTTNDANGPNYVLIAQSDGNLVLYEYYNQNMGPNVPSAWSSYTDDGITDKQLSVNNDGTFGWGQAANPNAFQIPNTSSPANIAQTFILDVFDNTTPPDPDSEIDSNAAYYAEYAISESAPSGALTAFANRKLVLRQQRWRDDRFKPSPARRDGSPLGDPIATGLLIAKTAWEFIKENRPVFNNQSATTSVLATQDSNPLDYTGATPSQSATYTWRGRFWPTNVTAFEIKVCIAGYYNAQAPTGGSVPAGSYIPSLYTSVPECTVYWPMNVHGSAQIMSAANVGPAGNVIPSVNVVVSLDVSDFAEDLHADITFTANGSTGFSATPAITSN